ncbi:hypothetical protein C2W62_07240 [Candidatus Entotheonella serta]|nr:hypothetical protein C2W62_07240 [Candidatus Entotheonella serta]
MRHAHIGSSYASQLSTRLYFGLDEATRIDRLTIHWPSGTVQTFRDIATRHVVQITEGSDLQLVALPKPPLGLKLSQRHLDASPNR